MTVSIFTIKAKGKTTGKFGVRYKTPMGQDKRQVVGTKKEAEDFAKKIEAQMLTGTYQEPTASLKALTLKQVGDIYFNERKTAGALKWEGSRWATILKILGENTPAMAINRALIVHLRSTLALTPTRRGAPPAPATINRHLALLRAALDVGIQNNALSSNPVSRDLYLIENNERDRIASVEEYNKLVAAAEPEYLRLAIILGYETGMRLGEICDLQWEHVTLQGRNGIARLARSKTGKGRIVPLSAKAAEALRLAGPSTGSIIPVQSSTISPLFAKLATALEIDNLHFHDLRHTAATRMRRSGLDLIQLKKIFGWSSWATAERYQTVAEDELLEAIRALDD